MVTGERFTIQERHRTVRGVPRRAGTRSGKELGEILEKEVLKLCLEQQVVLEWRQLERWVGQRARAELAVRRSRAVCRVLSGMSG